MRHSLRITALALALLMVTSFPAFAAEQNAGADTSGKTIAEQMAEDAKNPITMTLVVPTDMPPDPDARILAEFTRRTGITFEITTIPGDPDGKIGMLLASDSLPDIICVPNNQMINQFKASGQVLDILPFLKRSAPTVYELYSSDANYNVLASLVEEDGSLYGLINDFDLVWQEGEVIEDPSNADADYIWLPWATAVYALYPEVDQYAGEKITTPDAWYNAMVAFKEANPGDYATSMCSEYGEWLLYSFAQMYGYKVQTIGGADYGANFITKDDKSYQSLVRMPEALECLKFLNKLYKEGLMDPEGPIQNKDAFVEKLSSGRVFSHLGWFEKIYETNDSLYESDDLSDHAFIPARIMMPGVQKRWECNMAPTGYMRVMVSKNCPDPDRFFRFLEYLYSDEGLILSGWGIEGEDYYMEADGTLVGTFDDVATMPERIGMDFFQQLVGIPYHLRDGQYSKYLKLKYEDEGLNDTIAAISKTKYNYYRDFSDGYWADSSTVNIMLPEDSEASLTMAKIRTPINDMVCKAIMAGSDEEIEKIYNDTMEQLELDGLSNMEAAIQSVIDARRS